MELTVDPADFTRLVEHNVLAVDGRWFDQYGQVWGDELAKSLSSLELHRRPSPDLLALVGKECETCGDQACEECGYSVRTFDPDVWHGCTFCGDQHANPNCPACHGTGSELLTVETECPTLCDDDCEADCHEGHYITSKKEHLEDDCPGTRSLLVRLTGQPAPVVDYGDWEITGRPVPCVTIDNWSQAVHMYEPGGEGAYGNPIDLGPDPASLVGRWLWLPDALEVVG